MLVVQYYIYDILLARPLYSSPHIPQRAPSTYASSKRLVFAERKRVERERVKTFKLPRFPYKSCATTLDGKKKKKMWRKGPMFLFTSSFHSVVSQVSKT